jgi:hypothetical protein
MPVNAIDDQLTRTPPNWITFPQALREAIPEFQPCAGRVLQLDSAAAGPADSQFLGRRIAVKLRACETGTRDGVFDIDLDLNIAAAETLAKALRAAVERARR